MSHTRGKADYVADRRISLGAEALISDHVGRGSKFTTVM